VIDLEVNPVSPLLAVSDSNYQLLGLSSAGARAEELYENLAGLVHGG
jgi:hypothetical protein